MQKKIIAVVFIVCVLGIVFLVFKYTSKEEKKDNPIIYNAIPLSTNLIFEIKKIGDFINFEDKDNKIFEELRNVPSVKRLYNTVKYLDSLVSKTEYKTTLYEKPLIVCTGILGQKQFEFLYIIPMSETDNSNSVKEYVENLINKGSDVKKRTYNEIDIYDISLAGSSYKGFSYTIMQGLFIASPSPVMVEMSVRQLSSQKMLGADNDFKIVRQTAGQNVDVNVYVNMKTIQVFTSAFLESTKAKEMKVKPGVGAWAEFDANIKSGSILLNGYTSVTDSKDYLSILLKQSPVNFELPKVLPSGTSTFWALGIDNPAQFKEDYYGYLKSNQIFDSYSLALKNVNDELSGKGEKSAIENILFDIVENEMSMVFANVSSLNPLENTFAVIRTKSTNIAREQLVNVLNSWCEKKELSLKDQTDIYKISDDQEYRIYHLPVQQIPYKVFGPFFKACNAEYFTFVDNYLVFGNSVKSLSNFIHSFELKTTLDHDNNFTDFSKNLSDNYNFYFYSNVSKSYDIYPGYVDKDFQTSLNLNFETFQKFQAFAFQSISTKNMIYSNFYLNYNPITESKPHTVWESYIDTLLINKPKIVINHTNDEKEIFVQDAGNTIYLINKAGSIIWKKQISEQITSQVYQVDFYKNKKMQLVFSTKNYLYVIDRIGNFVEHFPIKFESPSTAGIALFDYDNNREYRIVVPCENKKVYLFDIQGKILKGWNFKMTESIVESTVQHFRVNDKDYLVFGDKFNTYIIDRKGDARVTVKEKFEKSKNNFYSFDRKSTKNEDRFITTDKEGNVKYINLNGTVQTVKITKFSPEHFFEFIDINADGYDDFIFLDKERLVAYTQKNEEIFDFDFENSIDFRPSFYQFSAKDVKIGIVDTKEGEIYLLNGNGKMYEGFPLKGRTTFSIGNINNSSSKFNLLVGGSENFLYNYEVK